MNWKEAVIVSKRLTARRTVFTDGKNKVTTSIVGYSDGSGYILVAKNGKVDFDLSHEAKEKDFLDLDKYDDWEPYI